MTTESFRKRFTFWLDLCKDDELTLAEEIDTLKKRRQFASYIRDGLRLLIDLKTGRTEVLLELFPWIRQHFQSEQKTVTERLAILEGLLMEQETHPNPRGVKSAQAVSVLNFTPAHLVETKSTEDYLSEVFDDLDDIGF